VQRSPLANAPSTDITKTTRMPTSSALVRWVFLPDFIHFFIYVLQALDPNIKTAYAKEKWEAVFYKAGCKRLEAVVSQFCCLLVLPVLTMSSLIPIMSLLLLCRLRMCKVLHQVSLCFYCPDFNLKLMKYRFHQITRPIWTRLDARRSSFSAGDGARKF